MLARQRGHHDIELFERDDAIRFAGLPDMRDQIEKQLDRRIVRQSEDFIKHVARPIFMQHLLFRDERDVASQRFALAHEVGAFEKGREADDVELARFAHYFHRLKSILRWRQYTSLL